MNRIHDSKLKCVVETFLRTGEYDPSYAAWPGSVLNRCRAGERDLKSALVQEIQRRSGNNSSPTLPGFDSKQFTRRRIEPIAAHLFHNCRRSTIGLPETERKPWPLHIDFRKREEFGYACEYYSRILTLAGGSKKERLLLFAEFRRPNQNENVFCRVAEGNDGKLFTGLSHLRVPTSAYRQPYRNGSTVRCPEANLLQLR